MPVTDPRGRRTPGRPIAAGRAVASNTDIVCAVDADLAGDLSGRRLEAARRDCLARTVLVCRGAWAPERDRGVPHEGFGLLMLDGLIVRRTGGPGRYGSELLGPGDLLRPWDDDGPNLLLPCATVYSVVRDSHLAVLDRAFAARLAPYPEVVGALTGRGMRRARTLAVQLAIAHHPRVDDRLLLLFWHLVERWGTVTPHGVHLPLDVTHECLAELVAARRPSISAGLARLSRDGRVTVARRGWLLHGEPPGDLLRTGALRRRAHGPAGNGGPPPSAYPDHPATVAATSTPAAVPPGPSR